MAKLKLANVNDVTNGEMIQSTINNKNYLIAKIDNNIYVTSDMCTHEDAELTMGCLDGTKVKCPLHGSFFDLTSGKALNEPAEDPIIIYKTEIKDNQIFIDD
jgi:3-phenylpropionate/trans-cinnamate dioxygenase ferredoxin subunit|tara:strand:+ start:49 stop:354 length:306 start_codon:yes stop_codon:yes gene_type:complete